jgi:hypothetical protein
MTVRGGRWHFIIGDQPFGALETVGPSSNRSEPGDHRRGKRSRRSADVLSCTLVVRSVDRLGRNYEDVGDTIREFMRRGVIIRTVINGLTFDGATTHTRSSRPCGPRS